MTARFAAAPIGPSLAATDGGLTLTTLAAALSVQRTARGSIGHRGVQKKEIRHGPMK